jgi:hypothetical protein
MKHVYHLTISSYSLSIPRRRRKPCSRRAQRYPPSAPMNIPSGIASHSGLADRYECHHRIWDFSAATFPGTSSFDVSILLLLTPHTTTSTPRRMSADRSFPVGHLLPLLPQRAGFIDLLGRGDDPEQRPGGLSAAGCRTAPFIYPPRSGDIHTRMSPTARPDQWFATQTGPGGYSPPAPSFFRARGGERHPLMDHQDSFNHMTTPPAPLRSTRSLFRPAMHWNLWPHGRQATIRSTCSSSRYWNRCWRGGA